MTRTCFLLAVSMLSFSVAACGDDAGAGGSGGDGGGGGSSATPAATESIVADEGGTVTDADHAVTLDVPAGALAEDTEISLFIEPKQSDTATDVFVFQPELSLSAPATITIDIFDLTFPEGQTVALVVDEGGSWVELAGSTFGSGTISAPTTELGKFSVIYVEAGAGGECEASCSTCCTTCGCAPEDCTPVCPTETPWDCEIGCCFDYDLLECAQ